MTRFLFQIILPLIAPLGVYILWLWYSRKRAEKTGDEPPAFTRGTAFWALIIGFLLMSSSFVWLAATGGVSPDAGVYEAPRFEDGKITEPTFTPQNTDGETSQ